MTAPKRICLLPDDGWSWVEGPKPPYEENAIEYVRADLAAVQPAQVRKKFPVLSSGGASVDLQLVDDHGEQAKKNHYQTITRLAERGGLCWAELFAVLHNRPFQKIDTNEAMIACRALESRYLAALEPHPDPRDALHRSFPDAGDGRPMAPMGDELMIAGLCEADARFVAVQLAQNGLTLTVQPDPRDEVIARLVEALRWQADQPEAHPFMVLNALAVLAEIEKGGV